MSTAAYEPTRQSTATTADPVTLTTMLFDGAVKAIRKARLHHEGNNRQGFVKETERAYLIVGELFATLDMEQGELPERLGGYLHLLHEMHHRIQPRRRRQAR